MYAMNDDFYCTLFGVKVIYWYVPSPGVREAAYKTLVHPQLESGSTVWSPHTQSNIKVIRWTLSNYSPYESVTDMQLSLGWRSLYALQNCSWYHCNTSTSIFPAAHEDDKSQHPPPPPPTTTTTTPPHTHITANSYISKLL